MMMNPTMYLYRFPGPRGPGPYTMKYWWTLGCFPTGLTPPFRLSEFLATYQQAHVPLDVEEFIAYFAKDPVESLVPALEAFLAAVEALPEPEDAAMLGYVPHDPSLTHIVPTLKSLESSLFISVPAVAVRGAVRSAPLRKQLCESVYEYTESVKASGSTAHRRAAMMQLSPEPRPAHLELQAPDRGGSSASASTEGLPSPALARQLGEFLSLPVNQTQPDEEQLIRTLTILAQGAADVGQPSAAVELLAQSLLHAHDANTEAHVHRNLAAAELRNCRFDRAAFHAEEASVRKQTPKAYASWTVALLEMGEYDRAQEVLSLALSTLEGHTEAAEVAPMLAQAQASLDQARAAQNETNAVRLAMHQRPQRAPVQQWHGLLHGKGRNFRHEFDTVEFQDKVYPWKMNPTSNELGSVFRRVHGQASVSFTSTNVVEPL